MASSANSPKGDAANVYIDGTLRFGSLHRVGAAVKMQKAFLSTM
jgi:hypothetical protein